MTRAASPVLDASWIIPAWPAPANVRAVATTRSGPGISTAAFAAFNLGSRCGDDPAAVAANRAALVRALKLPSAPCWLRQVHGTAVHEIAAAAPLVAEEPIADAVIGRQPGQVCAILTADCLPLLLCADDGAEVAALHAGWRGLSAGVIEACLARLSTPRSRLLAWLGPAIGPPSYEVGDEVRTAFLAHAGAATAAFHATRPGHWRCDLYALARQRLAAAGVTQVYGGGFDTYADARFYSYRRAARSGRLATLIWVNGATPADRD